MSRKFSWNIDPFPHLVIDNYLEKKIFDKLSTELDQTDNLLQTNFKTPLESKSIYKDTFSKNAAHKFIQIMGSDEIKEIIAQITGDSKIISMIETESFNGYSPYHVTNNNDFLGTHVDHSSVEEGRLRHMANTIFYASSKWKKNWGGETILYSKNGFTQEILIDPVPNRLILFIHTANSFHGVNKYISDDCIERRTFYHDYYVSESNIENVMDNINKDRASKLVHCFHRTTFIPFIPFGLTHLVFNKIFNLKNIKYIPTYLVYLSNRFFRYKNHISKKFF